MCSDTIIEFFCCTINPVSYTHLDVYKRQSPTTYTFRKKMALAVNSVVSYSARPLVYISYFGLAVTLVAML